jgi:hypothetical protein
MSLLNTVHFIEYTFIHRTLHYFSAEQPRFLVTIDHSGITGVYRIEIWNNRNGPISQSRAGGSG